jgi:DNA (cytosine-5)-methyltransferase 1
VSDVDCLDLFAGCGGVSLGLHLLGLADLGFELGAEECATRDAAGFLTVRGDLSQLDPSEFTGAEGLWDSSPCPDFSVAGKRAGRAGKSGWLVDEKMRWIKACKPRWIGCENVPGVEPIFREQALELQAMGYRTWVGCLSSEEYGVPQTRNRCYLMAHRDHDVSPPAPTHQPYEYGVPAQEVTTIFGTLRPWVSMAQALGWGSGEVGFQRLDDTGTSESGYRDRDLRPTTDPAFNLTEKARSWSVNTGRDWKPGGTRADAQTIPFTEPAPAPALTAIAGPQWVLQPGKQGGQPTPLGNRRLYEPDEPDEPDEPAPTLAFGHDSAQWCWVRPATTIAGDTRCFAPGGHHEPGQQSEGAIKLEVWEALLLQSAPPTYPLAGSRTAQFRQVGNMVPVRMATAVVGRLIGADWRGAIDDARNGR